MCHRMRQAPNPLQFGGDSLPQSMRQAPGRLVRVDEMASLLRHVRICVAGIPRCATDGALDCEDSSRQRVDSVKCVKREPERIDGLMDTDETRGASELIVTDEIKRARDETPQEALQATQDLLASFGQPRSRRWLMRGAVVGAASVSLASAAALTGAPVFAAASNTSVVKEIFSLAATAESLAVTFYNNGIANAGKLGLHGSALAAVRSFAREEDIHRSFFIANGGVPATLEFSFPKADDTFENLRTFIETQQQLEVVFDSAFLLSVKIFAGLSSGATLAQIAAQIAAVEQGHLAVGRYIGGFVPAEPYTFTPVLFNNLNEIVPTVKAAGYLSPVSGNRFGYHPAKAAFTVDNTPGGQVVLNANPHK